MDFKVIHTRGILMICFISIMLSGLDIAEVFFKRKQLHQFQVFAGNNTMKTTGENRRAEGFKNIEARSDDIMSKQVKKKKKICICTATFEELCEIPGIGTIIAKRIIAYRKSEKITELEQLLYIKGIGVHKLARIRKYVCIKRSKNEKS